MEVGIRERDTAYLMKGAPEKYRRRLIVESSINTSFSSSNEAADGVGNSTSN